MKSTAIVALRWLTLVALGIWTGGIVVLGPVVAAAIFHFCADHHLDRMAPQIFGAVLERFGALALALGVVSVLAWAGEGALLGKALRSRRLWRRQGACQVAMLAVTLYLGLVGMPRLKADMPAVVAESQATGTPLRVNAPGPRSELRREFDALHVRYTQLMQGVFLLGLVALGAFCWRVSLEKAED